MEKCDQRSDLTERTLIYWWRKAHLRFREMGRRLRRIHTSIWWELRRNLWCEQQYYPRSPQLLSGYRLQDRAQHERLKSQPVRIRIGGNF